MPDEFSRSRVRRSLLALGASAAAVIVLLALLPGLGSLRAAFAGAEPGWLVLGAVLEVLSCASYVLVFRFVFCDRMRWRTSAEIGLSECAANSLLSVGGAGGLALGAWILRRGGVPGGEIARRTVAFFLLTSLANVGFLALAGVALASGVLSGPAQRPARDRPGAGRRSARSSWHWPPGPQHTRSQRARGGRRWRRPCGRWRTASTRPWRCCARASRRSRSDRPATCSSTSPCSPCAFRPSATRCRPSPSCSSPTSSASSAAWSRFREGSAGSTSA